MKHWQAIDFYAKKDEVDAVEELCFLHGAISICLEDAADEPLFEPPLGQIMLWQNVKGQAIFEADVPLDDALEALGAMGIIAERARIHDKNWQEEWLKHYQPIAVDDLMIIPKWLKTDHDGRAIYIDPGLAFGTGYHATTRLCLSFLNQYPLKGARVLDFGTGSGILAVAACVFGADHVDAVDIDPQALIATTQNAEHNGVAVNTYLPADFMAQKPMVYDVIVANILANPLIALAPLFMSLLKDDGVLVMSGLTDSQVDEVIAAYPSLKFDITKPDTQSEAHWRRLSGKIAPTTKI